MLSPMSFRHRAGGTYGMGVCPGQAPIATDPFCLLRVKVVQSEENSAFCGVLVDIFQSVTAIRSANYTFSIKIITETDFKNRDGDKNKFPHHRLR